MKFDLIGVFFIGLLTSGLILVRGYGDVLMSDNLLENVDEIVVNHDDFNSFEKRLLSSTESEKSISRKLKGYLVNERRKCLKYYYWCYIKPSKGDYVFRKMAIEDFNIMEKDKIQSVEKRRSLRRVKKKKKKKNDNKGCMPYGKYCCYKVKGYCKNWEVVDETA